MALAVRVVCLMISLSRADSLRLSDIQDTIASTSWVADGWLCGRQIMSPREMSMSSSSTRVADIGGNASSTGPRAESQRLALEVKLDGTCVTVPPALITPTATLPAYP